MTAPDVVHLLQATADVSELVSDFAAISSVVAGLDGSAASTASSRATSAGTTASAADSKADSSVALASTADSKATSGVTATSVADSKATSVVGAASVADSKAVSVSLNTSIADSKGVSSGTRASIADSKAVSVGSAGGGNSTFLSGAITDSTNSSSTVYAAVSGSNVTVEAGKTYYIKWLLRTYSAAATTAPRPRRILAGGAAGTVYGFHYVGQSNASAAMLQSSREGTNDPFLATGNATSSTTASGSMQVECLFECSTGGTIGLEFLSEVNTSLVTISGDGSCWTAVVRTT